MPLFRWLLHLTVSLCFWRAPSSVYSATAFLLSSDRSALPLASSPASRPPRRRAIPAQAYFTCNRGGARSFSSVCRPSAWLASRRGSTTGAAGGRRHASQLNGRDAVSEGTDAPADDDHQQGGSKPRSIGAPPPVPPSLPSSASRRVAKKPRFVQTVHQPTDEQRSRRLAVVGEKDGRTGMPDGRGASSREAGMPKAKSPLEPRAPRRNAAGAAAPSVAAPPPSSRQVAAAPAAAAPRYDQDRMWKRSRSIEELELSLTKRWGTDARPWTDYDDDDVDDDDGAPATTTTSEESLSSASSPAVRVRPVWDPWEADVDDRSADSDRRRRRSSPSEPGKFLVSDLIRDRPVGGRGTLRDPAVTRAARPGGEAAESSKAGFFFRRPTSVTVEATPTVGTRATTDASRPKPSKDKKQQSFPSSSSALSAPPTHQISREAETQQAADGTPSVARRSLPAAAKPLYDEADGVTPLFLTIQQAQRNFEKGHVDVHGGEEQETGSDGGADSDAFLSDAPMPATTSWKDLGVNSQALLDNLRRMECHQPLTVQRTALEFLLTPPGVDGSSSEIMKDLIIGTMTGSGKTLSFLVPLAERMIDSTEQQRSDLQNQQQVLIVAPGRELASQIVSVARDLLQGTGLTVQLAIGGTTYARNLEALRKRKPHFIVGTPGRLAELMVGRPGESKGRLAKIFKPQTLVLDEFDALLEYKPHREKALALLQVLKRDASLQTIVCSATASDMMAVAKPGESSGGPSRRTVIDEYLRPGYRVTTGNSPDAFATADAGANVIGTHVSRTVIHGVVHVPHRRYALETLRRVLHTEPLPQQVLVFVQDARKVKIVVERLERNGIIAAPLSGDDDKTDRADVSRALREGYVGLVVASELAARGLDAPLLTHVINMDLPTDASHYAHRAGRCGRGGRPGVVINFTTMPQERAVPRKLADKLGIDMHTVEVRNGKLNIVDPSTQTIDAP